MHTLKKVVLLVSVVFLVNTAFGQPSTTITLQQGVDGYDGSTWIKMLSHSSEGSGNKKYIDDYTHDMMLTTLYEC